MILTTTNNIEGLHIQKYLGIVSGTEIYLVGGLIGGGLVNQEGLYTNALQRAMDRMEEKARNLGADAIVGVSTNFTSPGGLNSMIVAVTGTAVQTDAKKRAMEQEAREKAEKEAARQREQKRRQEEYRQMAGEEDRLNLLGRFLNQAGSCTRVSQVLQMWEDVIQGGGALTQAMEKKIRDTARVEKLYGASAGNVEKLIAELWQIMWDAEK